MKLSCGGRKPHAHTCRDGWKCMSHAALLLLRMRASNLLPGKLPRGAHAGAALHPRPHRRRQRRQAWKRRGSPGTGSRRAGAVRVALLLARWPKRTPLLRRRRLLLLLLLLACPNSGLAGC